MWLEASVAYVLGLPLELVLSVIPLILSRGGKVWNGDSSGKSGWGSLQYEGPRLRLAVLRREQVFTVRSQDTANPRG